MGNTCTEHHECLECQLYTAVPYQWYEHNRLRFYLLGLSLVVYMLIFHWIGNFPPLWVGALAFSGHALGLSVDIWSTSYTMGLKREFDVLDRPFPIHETNIFLPDYVTLSKIMFSIPVLISASIALLSFAFPGLGFSGSVMHGWAAITNMRVAKRAQAYLQLERKKG